MNKTLESVQEFHQTFGAPVVDQPQIPPMNRIKLRLSLLLEELHELAHASGAENEFMEMMQEKIDQRPKNSLPADQVEALDAFCDLQVVLNGAIIEYGLQHTFDDAFDEVHRSNMSKACESLEQGQISQEKYEKEGVETTLEEVNGRTVVYRASDHKILKGVNYSPPNLGPFIQ